MSENINEIDLFIDFKNNSEPSLSADTLNLLQRKIKQAIKDAKAEIKLEENPVGSIIFSTKNVNPSEYIGGTWVAWGSGRVPIGVNASDSDFATVEKTGGNKTAYTFLRPPTTGSNVVNYPVGTGSYYNRVLVSNTEKASSSSSSTETISTVQPFITCYMWKRTA